MPDNAQERFLRMRDARINAVPEPDNNAAKKFYIETAYGSELMKTATQADKVDELTRMKQKAASFQRQLWEKQHDIEQMALDLVKRDQAMMDAISFTRAVNRILKKRGIKVRLRMPKDQKDLLHQFADMMWVTCKEIDPQEMF